MAGQDWIRLGSDLLSLIEVALNVERPAFGGEMMYGKPCARRKEVRPVDIMKCGCGGRKKDESGVCMTATLFASFLLLLFRSRSPSSS